VPVSLAQFQVERNGYNHDMKLFLLINNSFTLLKRRIELHTAHEMHILQEPDTTASEREREMSEIKQAIRNVNPVMQILLTFFFQVFSSKTVLYLKYSHPFLKKITVTTLKAALFLVFICCDLCKCQGKPRHLNWTALA
jgi:hypothetical protein